MSSTVLVLRPEPGASETAARARALGLGAVVSPLFDVRPVDWEAPAVEKFDAVLLTSANAARHAGPALTPFLDLPCFAVGDATAAAAAAARFRLVRTGRADGAAALDQMARAGLRRAFHPSGQDHRPLAHPGLSIERRTVYAADAAEELPTKARAALEAGAVALIHSPRSGAVFGSLVDAAEVRRGRVAFAAISEAAAAAAGPGWKHAAVAQYPRDEALLAIAAKLCQNRRG